MKRLRHFLGSMAGRIFLVLFLGFTVAVGLALLAADAALDMETRHLRMERAAGRAADVIALFDLATPEQRVKLRQLGPMTLWPASAGAGGAPDEEMQALVRERLAGSFAGALAVTRLEGGDCRPPSSGLAREAPAAAGKVERTPPVLCWRIDAELQDGEHLGGVLPAPPSLSIASRLSDPWLLSVLALAAVALSFVVARIAAAPLHTMAGAADALGADLDRTPLLESGPREVRMAARALNRMQERLRATLQERTRMLASIAHDLQTPLTRMRLRFEKITDADLRQRLISDYQAMQTLTREGLEFLRSADSEEEPSVLDLRSLLESLVEDAVDAGHSAALAEVCAADVRVRPHALRRCLLNLMDNAIFYGGSVTVGCEAAGSEVIVHVRDRGPGIPEDELERVFEPFYRVEGSRSRETGGTGLGLTIARTLSLRAGARLSLANHPEGGLEATLVMQAHRPMAWPGATAARSSS